MLKNLLVTLAITTAINAHAQGISADTDSTLFFIDEHAVKASTFRAYLEAKRLPQPKNTQEQNALNLKVAQELINIHLLSTEALNRKLDENYEVKQEIELAKQTILMKALLKRYVNEFSVSQADIDNAYNAVKTRALQDTQYKLGNILVKTEKEAKEIIEALNTGGDFKKLQQSRSTENFGKAQENEWAKLSTLEPEIAEQVSLLVKNQYTRKPVKTRFGWHVIFVEDLKLAKIADQKDLQPKLANLVRQQKLAAKIAELRKKVKITNAEPAAPIEK